MCPSMQELPCVESFVIDDTVMVVGSMGDPSLCGQLELCKIVELDSWMGGHYVALRLRASLCIDLSSLGDLC